MQDFYMTHKCEFDKDSHTYYLINTESGERKQLISVTQILKKYGLGVDYSSVPSTVLERAAARGTLIHAEVENYIKSQQIGLSSELIDFIGLVNQIGLDATDSEFIVFNEYFAGTIDVGGWFDDGYGIADIKTTSTFHRFAVQWQLSLYAYLCKCMDIEVKHLGAVLLGSNSKYIDIDPIPEDRLNEVIKAVQDDTEYKISELTVPEDTIAEIIHLNEFIATLKQQKDEAEAAMQLLKDKLTESMRDNAVKTFENEKLKITYIEPSVRETLDTKALRADKPEIYTKYVKQSTVKDGVRITVR